jgi:hypothetical protein
MAKATLPTNYRDDILNVSTEGKRKYRMNYNDDGTVSFVDVTPYDQEGSDFGAGDINATNEAVNQSFDKSKIIRDMDAINALTQEGFAPDALALKDVSDSLQTVRTYVGSDGKLHFVDASGADSVLPFSGGLKLELVWTNPNHKTDFAVNQAISIDLSGYNYIYAESFYNTTEMVHYTGSTLISIGGTGAIFATYDKYTNSRTITVSNTGISFTASSGGTGYCIPYKIYGIK